MTISADNDRLTVIIPKTLKKELKILADQQNRSISNYVVTILQEHVHKYSNKTKINIAAETKGKYKV